MYDINEINVLNDILYLVNDQSLNKNYDKLESIELSIFLIIFFPIQHRLKH